jgi:hypothetical protein
MTALLEVPRDLAGTLELPEGVPALSEALLRRLDRREAYPDREREKCAPSSSGWRIQPGLTKWGSRVLNLTPQKDLALHRLVRGFFS